MDFWAASNQTLPVGMISFLALHGENGENGKVQAAFDLLELSIQVQII